MHELTRAASEIPRPESDGELRSERVAVNGVHLFVEVRGNGAPVLMIPGLGAGTWLWTRVADRLSSQFTLVMPELRGSARSDKPDERYSIRRFAEDVVAVADRLDLQRFHLLGASLGGFVAQYVAATWPRRVRRLVLVATALGGQNQIGPSGDILSRTIRPRGRTRSERLEDGYGLAFTDGFRAQHSDTLDSITSWRLEHPQPEFAYYRQLLAGNAYDGSDHSPRIEAPTLVCAAVDDPVVPVENARMLERVIPDARVTTFEGRHMFFLEHADEFTEAVADFLDGRPGRREAREESGS